MSGRFAITKRVVWLLAPATFLSNSNRPHEENIPDTFQLRHVSVISSKYFLYLHHKNEPVTKRKKPNLLILLLN